MKTYPSIEGIRSQSSKKVIGEQCIAQTKLDGQNIRLQWREKAGWYKYGTRHRLFDRSDKEFAPAIDLFLNKYAEPLERIFKDEKSLRGTKEAIVYCELVGPHSLMGIHNPKLLGVDSNPLDLVLFDVNPHKKGFVSPREFVKIFGKLHIPDVIYEGPLTEEFILEVRQDKFGLKEGVVVKGGTGHNIFMRKIKTWAYLDKIRSLFKDGWQQKVKEALGVDLKLEDCLE